MSNNQNWNDEDDFEFEDYEETPQRSSGDDVVKKLRRAERAKDKQLKEALAELENLRKFQRESVVSKVLSEKGVNPKVAAFIPQDIEPTADGVSSWLEQYGEIFGATVQETKSESMVSQNDLTALQQIETATSGALTPEGAFNLESAINNATSQEEIIRLLNG